MTKTVRKSESGESTGSRLTATDQTLPDSPPIGPNPNHDPVIEQIIQMWRLRQRWHRAEKSLVLQGKALCRAWTAGDKTAASDLFDKARADITSVDPTLATALVPFMDAIGTFEPKRDGIEKHLKKMVRDLPIWPFVQSIKGFGEGNLAGVIGECGDIGTYRNHSCLWKRMGLAVIDGERQRKCADLEKALVHGYNPSRRAVAFNLSDSIVRAQVRNVKDDDGKKTDQRIALGALGELYIARKAFEETRTVNDKPVSGIHAEKRARRYIVKRALRDLYCAWRTATAVASEKTTSAAPSATILSARDPVPRGLGNGADTLPAIEIAPKGHQTDAGSTHSVRRKTKASAVAATLHGHATIADATHSNAPSGAVPAMIFAPKGQLPDAGTTHSNASKDAGRANTASPVKASKRTSAPKSVAGKPAGKARRATSEKTMLLSPSRHSKRNVA